MLSVLRALHRPGQPWVRSEAAIFGACVLAWPGYLPVFSWYALRSKEDRAWMLLALLPLLGANYLLPEHLTSSVVPGQ